MSVDGITQALQQGLARLDKSLVFKADSGFTSTLTIGQIIKGKVLRHFDGHRYAVGFGGQERVVDSAIALRSGEIIHGRVIGLDDKVHLQRVMDSAGGELRKPAEAMDGLGARPGDVIEQLFQRYRATLTDAEQSRIQSVARGFAGIDSTALGALVLRKLGLALDPALIRAVTRALTSSAAATDALTKQHASILTRQDSAGPNNSREAVDGLVSALANGARAEPPPTVAQASTVSYATATAGDGEDGGNSQDHPSRDEWLVGRWLLNAQQDGALQHRFTTLPLWLGERLVEVSMAFFSQNHGALSEDGVRRQRVVFALDTAALGRVEVTVSIADRHLAVRVDAEDAAATEALASHLADLKSGLSAVGWEVDELSYVTRSDEAKGGLDGAARAVVEHHVRQDSLSRLL